MNKGIKLFIMSIISLFILVCCDKEVTTSPPDTNPENNIICVSTQPAGYDIYLNDRITGKKTPDSLNYLEADSYALGLKHTLYLDTSMTVVIGGEETKELDIDFTSQGGFYSRLECTTNPSDAEIIIDDSSTGLITPAILTGIYPGIHDVRFRKLGYRSKSEAVSLVSNVLSTLHMNLEDTTQWLVYNTENSDLVSNSLNTVAINTDVSNVMWVGTDDLGVMDLSHTPWVNYNFNNSVIPMNFVSKVVIGYDGNVIVGTRMGIAEYINGNWELFTTSNSVINAHDVIDIGYVSPRLSYVTGAVMDPGIFYMATESGGIISYSEGVWRNEDIINNQLPSLNTTCVVAKQSYNSSLIMVGTDDAGVYINNNFNGVRSVYNQANSGFLTNRVTAIEYEDGTYNLYVAVKQSSGLAPAVGMMYYTADGNTWQEISLDFATINVIKDNFEITWVGTNNGIYKLLDHTQIAEHITKDNSPLPSNNIYDLMIDRTGDIWCATTNGLVRYRP